MKRQRTPTDPHTKRTFGSAVADYRARADVPQEQLIAKVGRGGTQIPLIETGRRRGSAATLERIIKALNLTEQEADELRELWEEAAPVEPPAPKDDLAARLAELEARLEEIEAEREKATPQVRDNTAGLQRLWDRVESLAAAVQLLVDQSGPPPGSPPRPGL